MKQIIGLGGGGFTMEKSSAADRYIIEQAKKEKPRVCFLPTAGGDNMSYIYSFVDAFSKLNCDVDALPLINPPTSDIEDFLMSFDIIYVGGGNTKSMLAIWREWDVDNILRKCYDNNIVLAGVSAGSVCWFKECVSDSIPNKFIKLPCLGLLPYSNVVHYMDDGERRQAYLDLIEREEISDGFACPNGTGIHFINGKLHRTFRTRTKGAAVVEVKNFDGCATETILETERIR